MQDDQTTVFRSMENGNMAFSLTNFSHAAKIMASAVELQASQMMTALCHG